MNFHFVMMLIVVLVSLSMHSMASAAPPSASIQADAPGAAAVTRDCRAG